MAAAILDAALDAHTHGLTVIPIKPYDPNLGDKRPAIRWKTTRLDTEASIRQWWDSDQYGLAIAMGEASNGLIMIELEGAHAHKLLQLATTFEQANMGDLWACLTTGWFEQSPSGGYHWYAYAPGNTSGNRKLARTPDKAVIAETRENGGYSVIAPTDARFHASGKPWVRISGGPSSAITLTPEQLDDVLAIFRTLDETPAVTPVQRPTIERRPEDGITPGDDYEAKTSWVQILEPHGWKPAFTRGQETFWTRPGKQHGISASTGHADDRDRLYVWSSSTDFDTETPYTKFAAYTLLNHAGDYTRAAKALAAEGYGEEAVMPRKTIADIDLDNWITNNRSDLHKKDGKPATKNAEKTEKTEEKTETTTEPETYSLTDDGNALHFADLNHGTLLYIPQEGKWAHWDGHTYNIDAGDQTAMQAARNLGNSIPDNKTFAKHKTHTLTKNGLTSMLYIARNDPRMWHNLQDFDSNPYLLNTPEGTVDLTTGHLTHHTKPGNYLRSTLFAPQHGDSPIWHRFLDQTFLGDETLINFFQKATGAALIGKPTDQKFFLCWGKGRNGKTTIFNTIQKICGTGSKGYTETIPANMLLTGATNRHPTELAQLAGVRIAVASEIEQGKTIDEARFKQLTGSDLISARKMRQDFFTFEPTHTLFLLTNSEPEVKTGGEAFWRRMIKIPFLNIVPVEEIDPNLEEKLITKEAPQILQWLIDGAAKYITDGLNPPESVRESTTAYKLDQDTVAQFLADAAHTWNGAGAPPGAITAGNMHALYTRWCTLNGLTAVDSRTFGKRMTALNHPAEKSHGIRIYRGLSIEFEGANL